jgi:hypothetical protein
MQPTATAQHAPSQLPGAQDPTKRWREVDGSGQRHAAGWECSLMRARAARRYGRREVGLRDRRR